MNKSFVISLNLGIWLLLNIQLSAQENASFQFIVEPYLQQVTDTSFSVLWETSESAKGMIFWGEAEFNVLKPSLREKAEGNIDQHFHRVMVKGVKPGSIIVDLAVMVRSSKNLVKSNGEKK